jgi:hypothetical protein
VTVRNDVTILKQVLGAFAKLLKAAIRFVTFVRLAVCPHGTTQLPIDRLSSNLRYKDLPKIIRENPFH